MPGFVNFGMPAPTKRASVEIKLGKVDGEPVARAFVFPWKKGAPEPQGTPLFAVELGVDPDQVELRTSRRGYQYFGPRWKSRQGTYGKLFFHMLSQVKARLEKDSECWVCGAGRVYLKREHSGRAGATYTAWWKAVELHDHQCSRCWERAHPVKAAFDPTPELNDDGIEYDTKFASCVNELRRVPRDALLEDVEYMYALDVQATKELLSHEREEEEHLSGAFGQAAVEILQEEFEALG